MTPDSMDSINAPKDSVVVVVSSDCIAAVDATCQAQGRYGVYIGDQADAALAEMRQELYDYR